MIKNYLTFQIFGQQINLISSETECGINTVAEMPDQYYYLGNEKANIMSAVFAWQEVNNREMNDKEINQVLNDNGFIESH